MSTVSLPSAVQLSAAGKRRLVLRSFRIRLLALALGGTAVGSVFHVRGMPTWIWAAFLLHVLAWPPVTLWWTRRSRDAVRANRNCFLVDAVVIGCWIGLMAFNLVPSVVLATLTAMCLVATEGPGLLLRGMALQVVACALVSLVSGFPVALHTGTLELLASLPLIIVFPITIGFVTYGLAQRVRSQNRELVQLSSTDALTGLHNRRHWEALVKSLLDGRQRQAAVMLMLDIDNFKQVNDQCGHVVGDEVIRMVGAAIHDSVRTGDFAGRYGGDEFGVVLRGACAEAAAAVGERIRARVAAGRIPGAPGLQCTLSIGIAPLTPAMQDASDWTKAADSALYSAKLAGRNRVQVL